MTRRGLAPAVALAALALAGCAAPAGPGADPGTDGPSVSGPAAPGAASAACLEAYPSAGADPRLEDGDPVVPADWPAPPAGAELCVVMPTSEVTVVLQYAASIPPDAVLDHYEAELGAYDLERSAGVGDAPILNAQGPGLAFAIQTDPLTGGYLVAFESE